MTVSELVTELQAALDRGLPPDTTVVVENVDEWFQVIARTSDPTSPPNEWGDVTHDMWFTLIPGELADCRDTPGGLP